MFVRHGTSSGLLSFAVGEYMRVVSKITFSLIKFVAATETDKQIP